jgi:S-formylglutathione hydrolase FrmB
MTMTTMTTRLKSSSRALLAASLASMVLAVGCSKSSSPPATTATTGAADATSAPAGKEPAALSASRVVTETMRSEALGVDKSVLVYLPRGYDSQPGRKYPVFYYLHGLGGDETNWVESGKLDAQADQLGLEAIVVMPDGDDSFYVDSAMPIDYDQCLKQGTGLFLPGRQDPQTTCVRKRNYETYIAKDLVGWVDRKYRTIATREGRAIAGLSMGGFGAMELGLRHSELFSAAASHSGAVALLYKGPHPFEPGKATLIDKVQPGGAGGPLGAWLQGVFGGTLDGWRKYDVVALATALPPGVVALYFDCGTEDSFRLHDNVQYVHEALDARRIPHEFFLGPGGHDFDFWRVRLPSSLTFLRDHTAKAQ